MNYPLSYGQKQIYYLSQETGSHYKYTISGTLRIQGQIDVERLNAAFNRAIGHFEIHNSKFYQNSDGSIMRRVAESVPFTLCQLEATEENLKEKLTKESKIEFDLENGPLFKIFYIKLPKNQSLLHFVYHHIIIDEQSFRLLIDDVVKYYNDPFTQSEKRVSFDEYVKEQNEKILSVENLIAYSRYWNDRLINCDHYTDLSENNFNAAGGSACSVYAKVSLDILKNITGFCSVHSLKFINIFLAALALVSREKTSDNHFSVGITYSGRKDKKYSKCFGYFVNTLPFFTKFDGDQTFVELASYIKNELDRDRMFQDMPLSACSQWLKGNSLKISQSQAQILVNYVRHHNSYPSIAGAVVSREHIVNYTSKAPLVFNINEYDQDISIEVDYLDKYFSGEFVQDIIDKTLSALEFAIKDGNQQNENSKKVLNVIKKIIGNTQLDLNHSFYANGGHSLQALQTVSVVRKSLGLEIKLEHIMGEHSLSEMLSGLSNQTTSPDSTSFPPIMKATGTTLPLSSNQQRLWIVRELNPRSPQFNRFRAFEIRGSVQKEKLESAVSLIISKHESLRTSFHYMNAEPIQVIHDEAPFSIQEFNLSHCHDDEARTKANQYIEDWANEEIDVGQAPLMRIYLIKMPENKTLLALYMHHIIADAQSISLFFRELRDIWQGKSVTNNRDKYNYRDFTNWQRLFFHSPSIKRQLEFWENHLGKEPPLPVLPHDKSWPQITSQDARLKTFTLDGDLYQKIIQKSSAYGVTPFTILLSALRILLARLSGKNQVVIGIPVHGRRLKEFENIFGFFINMLPVRVDVNDDKSFGEHLIREKNNMIACYENQDASMDQIIQMLKLDRQFSRSSLYHAVFNYIECPDQNLELSGCEVNPYFLNYDIARDPLQLRVFKSANAFSADFIYLQDLFSDESIEVIKQQYLHIIENIVSVPEQKIAHSVFIDDKSVLLHDKWRRFIPNNEMRHVLDVVRQHALEKPLSVAVTCENHEVTYQDLIQLIDDRAKALRKSGCERLEKVAVVGSRSLETIISILAVMRLNSIVVPIDVTLPKERQHVMIREAQCKKIICSLDHDNLDYQSLAQVIHSESLKCDLLCLLPILSNQEPAYIYFTSGSTGIPKGILGSLNGLAHYIHWVINELKVTSSDHIGLLYGISFEPFMREMFMALCSGAVLDLAGKEVLDGSDMVHWLEQRKISILHTVPSVGKLMVGENENLPCKLFLRYIIFGGEALTSELIHRWRNRFSGAIINIYGPTETTLAKTFYHVPQNPREGIQPLGRAISDTEILVMSANRPCSIGELGEIVIKTPYRSFGYLPTVPEKDRQRFFMNPLSQDSQDIVYLTGDKGKYNAFGEIEILGRVDDEVKIRGVRVQPSEVVAVLQKHEKVLSCAVVSSKNKSDETELVAYVVTKGAQKQELRQWLISRLPGAFIPSQIIFINEMPLSRNGKIDKSKLPSPTDVEMPIRENIHPSSLQEEMLVNISTELLGLNDISLTDNFFDLGGHSLMATRLVARLRKAFNTEISLKDIFDACDIRDLAKKIILQQQSNEKRLPEVIPAKQADARYPLSYSQHRLWFLHEIDPEHDAFNLSRRLMIYGPLRLDWLHDIFSYIIERHSSLRTFFGCNDEGIPYQEIAEKVSFKIRFVDLSKYSREFLSQKIEEIQKEQIIPPFDFTKPPFIRVCLVKIKENRHLLVLTIHHIISDGWSLSNLTNEICQMWLQKMNLGKIALEPLPVQYSDYAVWQKSWMNDKELNHQHEYWKQKLGDNLPILHLPHDKPWPDKLSKFGGRADIGISKELVDRLKAIAKQNDATLFMILLATFRLLLAKHSHQNDFVIGIPIAGRRAQELEGLIGFFINMLPIRVKFADNIRFLDLLKHEKDAAMGAYLHQDYSFDKMVEDFHQDRSSKYPAIYQVVFNFRNMPQNHLEIPGVVFQNIDNVVTFTRDPLMFNLVEDEGHVGGRIIYSEDLFSKEQVLLLREQYLSLLKQIAENPEKSLSAYLFDDRFSRRLVLQGKLPLTSFHTSHNDDIGKNFENSREFKKPDLIGSINDKHMLAVMRDLLQRDEVEITDNFFDLGGHSLLATQLVARLRKKFGVKVPLSIVFETATIADMLSVVEQSQKSVAP